ncbi:MAG: DUF3891 family protein [Phycisphaerales bacterium JB043]
MFRLRSPDVVVSQHEHSRISGELARRWGNERFDTPELDTNAFVAGVTLHDWHYGVQDTLSLDAEHVSRRDEETWRDWVAVHARSSELRMDDPIVEIVAKMHIRRLLDDVDRDDAERVRRTLESRIDELIASSAIPRQRFEWADHITRACDLLAFYLFREDHTSGEFEVPTRAGSLETIQMRYEMGIGTDIRVDPWPFDRDAIELNYVAYDRDSYPSTQRPVMMRLGVHRLV